MMGAGSSVPAESSDDEFESYEAQIKGAVKANPTLKIQKTIDEVLAADDLEESPPTSRKEFDVNQNNPPKEEDNNAEKADKKKGLFGFRKKEEEKITTAVIHEEEKNKKDKGFRFFNWRKESKKAEKDEHLTQEINDIEKTFDSLGLKTKSENGSTQKKKQRHSIDDISNLEPMRNRNSMRRKSINNSYHGNTSVEKRTFKYSWEKEPIKSPVESEDWNEFTLNKIEGFDLEKFQKINAEVDSLEDNSFNNINGNGSTETASWMYDQKDKELLASIEREYLAV